MQENSKVLNVRIENADTWASCWITFELYKLVDKELIDHFKIENVSKSKHSIELEILIYIVGYAKGRVEDVTVDMIIAKIRRILQKWKDKRKQTTLEMFIDDFPLE